jgi:type II secretory pathway component GspD/PulD (secretin)
MNLLEKPTSIPIRVGPEHRFVVLIRKAGVSSAAHSVRCSGMPTGSPKTCLRLPAARCSPRVLSQLLLAGLALALCLKSAALAQTPESQASVRLQGTSAHASAGAVAVENATNSLCLNFHSAPVDLVLEYLSEACGFVINRETDVRGTVDVWSNGSVTAGEAVERLNSSLKRLGYAVTRRGRILTVVNLDQSKTADLEIVTGNDPDTVRKSDEIVTQIIPVRYANVGQLANNLQPLLPASASLSVNESANALILVATSTEVRRMLKIISALDGSIARVSSIKVFPLHYADATELAAVVQQLFASEGAGQSSGEQSTATQPFSPPSGDSMGSPGSPEPSGVSASSERAGGTAAGSKVVALAEERSNCLIVCASAGLIPTVTAVVQRLDRQVNEPTELRVFHLHNADPGELAEQLAQLFPNDTASGSAQDQAEFSFDGLPPPGSNLPDAATSSLQSDGSERKMKQSRVLAVADPRTSSLLVGTASSLMPQIAALIGRLDTDPGRKEVMNFWELRNADPQDVKQVLQDLFNRNTTAQNNNNPLLGQNNPLTTRQTQQQTSTTTGSFKLGNSGTSGAAGSAAGF